MSARTALLALAILTAFPAAAAAGPPPVAGEEAFQAGEAAFRAGDTRAAEAHYRRAVEENPAHVEAMLALAKVVSWHDRLEESISIYERALEVDPGNLKGRLGLAIVEAWTADFRRATSLYEGILAEHPGHREATLGLARTRAWAGDTTGAIDLYWELLDEDAGDVEARNGLAQALSWQGRLDEALALYDETLARHPDDAEALAGRARILLWQGRSPQAWEAAGEAAKVHPGHREVVKIREAIEERFASEVSASAGVMHDSDKNAIDTQSAVFTLTPGPPAALAFSYTRFDASQPCGAALFASSPCDRTDPNSSVPAQAFPNKRLASRLETFRAQSSLRVRPDLSLSAGAGLERIDRERDEASLKGTASVGIDYRLDDDWSFSGSLSRETFAATALTLDRGVGLAAATASAAWTPTGAVGTRFTVQRADFSDGNDRDLLAAYARWSLAIARRPRVALTANGRYLAYGEPEAGRENGYFAPDRFEAIVGGVELSDRIGRRIGWSASGTLGKQRVRALDGGDSASDTVRGYYLTASYDFGARVSLEGWVGRTNLALQGPTGFTSMESGVRLKWKTGWLAPGLRGGGPSAPPAGAEEGGGLQ